jgi:hypothetical protein
MKSIVLLTFTLLFFISACNQQSTTEETIKGTKTKIDSTNIVSSNDLENQIYREALGSQIYNDAWMQIETIKLQIRLADSGVVSSKEVVQNFNNLVGMTMGVANDLPQVKMKMSKDTAFLRFVALKEAARIAMQKAADANFKGEQLKIQ